MLALDGNTAPYLQYAHARIRSIFRRAGDVATGGGVTPTLGAPEERALALALPGFAPGRRTTRSSGSPRTASAAYLFELAQAFTGVLRRLPGPAQTTSTPRRARAASRSAA